jgi:ADP-ribosylglycohydrolase
MARKQAQPDPEVVQEANKPTEQNPLEAFATHQRNAAVEAGRALASLIPRGLRVHGWNAIVGAVADSVSSVAKTVRDEVILPDDEKKDQDKK